MRKLAALVIITALLLSITACGRNPDSLDGSSELSSRTSTSGKIQNDTTTVSSTLIEETTSTIVSINTTKKATTSTTRPSTTTKKTSTPTNATDNIDVNMTGNTDGNLANGGYVSFADNWIYYTNFQDEERLYKVRADGSGKTKVSNDTECRIIQVYDGWAYYESIPKYNSFRVRLNGVDSNKASLGFLSFRITPKGIWGTSLDERYGNPVLKKSALDGSMAKPFPNTVWYGIHHVETFVYDGDWIYYVGNVDMSDELTSIGMIKKDGSARKTLLKGEVSSYILGLQKVGNWLYFTNWSDDSIWKIKTDGSQKTAVLTGLRENDDIADFNINGDSIYYIKSGKSLCKSNLNGGQQTTLYTSSSDKPIQTVSIVNGRIYFIESLSDGKALRSVTTNGGDYKTL